MTGRQRGVLSTGQRDGGRLSPGRRGGRALSALRATLAAAIVTEWRLVTWTV
jgi:hypothetical protein